MQWLLFTCGLVAVLSVANAFRPSRGRWMVVPSFVASWLTTELALQWLVLLAVVAAVTIIGGALESVLGIVGLVLVAAGAVGLVGLGLEGWRTRDQMRAALAGLNPVSVLARFPRWQVAVPFLMQQRPGVRRVRNIAFARVAGRTLHLDLTLPSDARPGEGRPVVLQIHGGAWVIGDKRQQAQPLLNHLAAQGWVCVNANYRLSPMATFPDHLIDCKRALAWIRQHVADYGGDPTYVSVTGQSAGGHLAALVGLTANQAPYQPGFEDVDTSVRAAVPIYGIYDVTNRLGTWSDDFRRRVLEPWVIKAFLDDEPERFAAASPIDHVHAEAPPFLVLHGDRDVLAPLDDTRLFVEHLREVSRVPVLYAELKGAQHAFELFPSLRAAYAVEGIEQFLQTIYERSHQRLPEHEQPDETAPIEPPEEAGLVEQIEPAELRQSG